MTRRLSARIETATDHCAFCPKMCRFACPVAESETRETVTPWGLMSLLRGVRLEQIELTPEVGEVFYHCTGCYRCQAYCLHENDVPEAMFAVRRMLVDGGIAVPEVVQGLDLIQQRHGSPFGPPPPLGDTVGEVFESGSQVGYKPSCRLRDKHPEAVLTRGRVLEAALGFQVALIVPQDADGRDVHCCGGALTEAGYGATAEGLAETTRETLMGMDRAITDCVHTVRGGGAEHILSTLATALPNWMGEVKTPSEVQGRRVFYLDGGQIGRGLGLYDGPRAILGAVLGAPPEEFWLNHKQALADGQGAHYDAIDPEGSAKAAQNLIASAREQGAEVLVTSDAASRDHLKSATDMPVFDVLDLVALALGLT